MQTMIARRKSGGGPIELGPMSMKPEIVRDEDGDIDGRHLAAQDMMMAMKEGSAEKFHGALQNYLDIHNSMKDDPEVEPEPEDED